jgi:hypothetical protein
MVSYQLPSRAQETAYCRQEIDDEFPSDCNEVLGFYRNTVHLPIEYLRVGKSGVGERAGRGLFATRDMPSHAAIGIQKETKSFMFPPLSFSLLTSFFEWSDKNSNEFPFVESQFSSLYTFADGMF